MGVAKAPVGNLWRNAMSGHWFSLMGTCLPFEIITMPFESGKFPAQIGAFLVGLKRLRELLGW